MAELVVRRLLIDLETPPERHWCGGDAFRTAWFNALSMSFPAGEQFFIDSVRAGVQMLPEEEQARFEPAIRGFIGQEATHRRIHALFNAHLAKQGLVNHWEARALRRIRQLEGVDVRAGVGATAATEHLTAIMAEHLLSDASALQGVPARWATLWLWHASEETEHRATAFDLYRALGGNEKWRLRLFRLVTWHFVTDALRQTVHNLWRDGSFWRASTWASGWRFLFGRRGLLRALAGPWARYRSADFHPSQQDESRAVAWLRANSSQFEPVGRLAPAGAVA
ncbi:MAG TPA: metal-dependent hydrolase [Burkholderiaceae bacterium]|nr:metal-dependent hydrolase [Burkholderiaceae bacterium]